VRLVGSISGGDAADRAHTLENASALAPGESLPRSLPDDLVRDRARVPRASPYDRPVKEHYNIISFSRTRLCAGAIRMPGSTARAHAGSGRGPLSTPRAGSCALPRRNVGLAEPEAPLPSPRGEGRGWPSRGIRKATPRSASSWSRLPLAPKSNPSTSRTVKPPGSDGEAAIPRAAPHPDPAKRRSEGPGLRQGYSYSHHRGAIAAHGYFPEEWGTALTAGLPRVPPPPPAEKNWPIGLERIPEGEGAAPEIPPRRRAQALREKRRALP